MLDFIVKTNIYDLGSIRCLGDSYTSRAYKYFSIWMSGGSDWRIEL